MDNYKGFYKVNQEGTSLTIATFYNPETRESFTRRVWDMDDDRLLYDEEVQELRYMQINKEIRWLWLHRSGIIQIGDTVKVVKGRKLPVGKTGKVKDIKPYFDRYRRWCCDYIYFDDGTRTSIKNCVLVED